MISTPPNPTDAHSGIPVPSNITRLPRDKHGRPIPWFVHIDEDGIPDFRVIRRAGIEDACRFTRCWVCGQTRGRYAAFVIGPMCAVNRTTAEPPAHRDCAIYAAQACPFLATPTMRRRETGLPDVHVNPAGEHIWRNPGAAVVWVTRTWKPFRAPGGVLFELGEPTDVAWYAHGRSATRDEVAHSIDTGYPILLEAAERDGPAAVAELEQRLQHALALLPTGADIP
jgi:hypothetical protein